MASDINRWNGTGTLVRDSEQSYTQSGYSILKFSIASNYSKKQGDGWTEEASFFDCILWGKRGEAIAQYLVKGQSVALDGRLKQERWEKDGQKRSKVVIEIDDLKLMGGKRDGAQKQDKPKVEDEIPW